MTGLLDPRLWLAALIAAIFFTLAGYGYGYRMASNAAKVREAAVIKQAFEAKEAADKKVADTEKLLRATVAEVHEKSFQKEQRANEAINNLRRSIRLGTDRLSIPIGKVLTVPGGGDSSVASGTPTETRAELLPTVAEDLINLVGDANSEVRRTNECIDHYAVIRSIYNK
jgi:hypothetical protein